ncbi:uncharacterized protein BJ171DRAFT_422390 [Polychytrium aggregatum]|uniref:uncharacterized protein n=1 Tax=Polychytrium aggregatum TaxID=110093 RepID=UPI0022FEFC0E|nr:uncharacterized protein BJ171DRAFT_422390 [Polychytrium aggregatum]KAI9206093.1 hypothetical protein BJ171DRAFT_422390 [Polychytrium aggregatum]
MQVASTFFNKPASSFHSAKAKKPKKYVLQSAEFYGADFSLPPENPELENLHRPPPDSQTTSELDRIRAEQGSVFISALNSIIFNRSERASVPSTDSPDPAAGSPSSPQQPESSQFVPKPLASVLNPAQQQPVDYSELFPPFIAKTEGVSIFRIESLKPALQSDSTFGKFCTADCYIILNATRQDGADADVDMDDHDYDYKIFSWIGNQAELDKRFCAAMFAVGLRNWIGTSETVERETDSDESESFLDLFGDNFEILDASYATDSGLYVTEKRRYPTRLYRVQGKAQVVLQLVEPSSRSLRSDGVFLLDVGYALYQWNGSKSSLQHKSKCRIMVDRISKSERAGKNLMSLYLHSVHSDESDEPSRFWSILGGERTQDEDQDVDEEHAEFVTLYQSSDISPALYRATEELADEVEGHTVTAGKMKRAMLESEGCYILDTGVELNLWIGKLATLALKSSATELLTRIVPVRKRPKWVALNKHWEGHETEVFKLWFVDWDDKLDINWEDVKQGKEPPSPISTHRNRSRHFRG